MLRRHPPVDVPGLPALHRRRRRLPRLRRRADHRVAARRAAGRPRSARRDPDGDRHAAGARQPVQPRHGHRQRRGAARGRRRRAARGSTQAAEARIDDWLGRLGHAGHDPAARASSRRRRCRRPISPYPDDRFQDDVRRIKEYIAAGDTFQTVLSRRLELAAPDPFLTYRYLRALNPAPYLYYLHCDDIHVIGSSPEILVRVEDGEVTLRPIAGTRPRGATPEQDAALADELAGRSQGARRAPDAGGSGAERRGPGGGVRHGAPHRLHDDRALLPRHAPGERGARPAPARSSTRSPRSPRRSPRAP